jgi:hypothetical protein
MEERGDRSEQRVESIKEEEGKMAFNSRFLAFLGVSCRVRRKRVKGKEKEELKGFTKWSLGCLSFKSSFSTLPVLCRRHT